MTEVGSSTEFHEPSPNPISLVTLERILMQCLNENSPPGGAGKGNNGLFVQALIDYYAIPFIFINCILFDKSTILEYSCTKFAEYSSFRLKRYRLEIYALNITGSDNNR
jgi:hypothetical protein